MAGEKETAQIAQVEANAAQEVAAVTANAAAVVDAAAAQVAAAQETAQNIVEAAMQTPLAEKVANLQKDADEWESQQEQLHEQHANAIQALQSQMVEVLSRLATLETPKPAAAIVVTAPTSETDQSLIPGLSEAPLTQEAVIVQPETSIPQPESVVISAAPRKRQTRFL